MLHRDNGERRGDAVRKALKEITTPLIGSTITPVVVFLPLVFGVLLTEFRNFPTPIAILTSSVLSISGVILALLVTRTSFTWRPSWGSSWSSASWPKTESCCSMPTRSTAPRESRPATPCCTRATPVAPHRHDGDCGGARDAAAGLCAGRGFTNAAAAGYRGHWRLTISMVLSLVVTPVVYFLLTRDREALPEV